NPLPAPRGEGAHRVAVRSSSSFHAESCKLATSLLRPHAHRLEPPMQLNAFFPSLDIGSDPAKIRDWAQAAEDLGYAYIEVPDHVFGATARDGWVPLYNEKASFHETFVTLGFLAAVTKNIRLSSGFSSRPSGRPESLRSRRRRPISSVAAAC